VKCNFRKDILEVTEIEIGNAANLAVKMEFFVCEA
jgi:hypothetical protein